MHNSYPSLGRRERNKQDKLARIVDVATALFEEHGVDHVTIQQITERAGIGKGTLFLYARNKGELVLLVQNAHYAASIERGRVRAERESEPMGAIGAIVSEVVVCNRIRIDNGRNYLREILFGNVEDPHRKRALEIVAIADRAIAHILATSGHHEDSALERAQMISHTMFMTLALSENVSSTDGELVSEIMQKAALVSLRTP